MKDGLDEREKSGYPFLHGQKAAFEGPEDRV
jgi:hypothetical protein